MEVKLDSDNPIIVPWRDTTDHRAALWTWCQEWWGEREIVVADDDQDGECFNHSRALNRAVARCGSDVLVIVDADTVCDPLLLDQMVAMVRSNEVPWCVTTEYVQLTRSQTDVVLATGRLDWQGEPEWVGHGATCCGVVVVPRQAFDLVGGFGWGANDGAFRCAVDALWGNLFKVKGETVHLWHPRADPLHRYVDEQHAVIREYTAAAGDREAMLELLARRTGE